MFQYLMNAHQSMLLPDLGFSLYCHRIPTLDYLSHVMKKHVLVICKQQRCRSACICAQSDHLISTIVVRYLDSIIPILAKSKISRLQFISVDEQAGLSLTWSETLKTGFLMTWLI